MSFDEPIGGNIQHTTLAKHNTGAVPSATIVKANGATVADASGTTVVDADGAAVAKEDPMTIATLDYRQPITFVFRGLMSLSVHSAPQDMHQALPCPTA